MPIDPAALVNSIGTLPALDLERGLDRALQQVVDAVKALFNADAAGLMLADASGSLRWASASDQTAQTVEAGQERLGLAAALSVPVEVESGPIGTLDVYACARRDWDPSEVAALQAYAGVVGSLLASAVAAQVQGRLATQLQTALEHRSTIEQAKGLLMARYDLDAQAAFERLRRPARSSGRTVVDLAREVLMQHQTAGRRDPQDHPRSPRPSGETTRQGT